MNRKNARADRRADLQQRNERSRKALAGRRRNGCGSGGNKIYIAELEEDIMPIDTLIAFAGSEQGISYFGAEAAAGIAAHAKEIKAAGARYCDCPACAIAEEILRQKSEIFA